MRMTSGIDVGGMYVATRHVNFVWAKLFFPNYSSPHLTWTFLCECSSSKERGTKVYDLVIGRHELRPFDRASDAKDLTGFLKIEVPAADAWFKEDEPIYVCP
ncbi:uncharacterized protein BJ212DRAFT_1485030 [Suillus subaureus]|uniref:Uncharacterized protein n=1 Tax=Suillus subaureus TaxID=48587 RepID=A0A9P7AMA3_9AGAM|nr:uncharacterized protein BJ212DRAFT_1490658 [Suillus subaureus]XP_041188615.1 uncharacterized protein BJ212DRAFT_1485030 [Suillus subaureus]KAG1792391.1 hypothetical protein BJ212DRAFT_1490658 [Suillus subaureus]KAG1808400.1 hypothetical protein BJ212DRAFT_1485030 [Suillus subaureus]